MAMRKSFVSVELIDGTVIEDERVLAADKVRAEGVFRSKGWPFEDGPRLGTVLAWAALQRAGHTDTKDVADFLEQLADYQVTNADPDDEDEPDPT